MNTSVSTSLMVPSSAVTSNCCKSMQNLSSYQTASGPELDRESHLSYGIYLYTQAGILLLNTREQLDSLSSLSIITSIINQLRNGTEGPTMRRGIGVQKVRVDDGVFHTGILLRA